MALTSDWAGSSGWLQWWAGEEKETKRGRLKREEESGDLEEKVKSWDEKMSRERDQRSKRKKEKCGGKREPRWRCWVKEEYMGYIGCI